MPANIKSNGVDLDNIFSPRQSESLSNNTNVLVNGADLSQEYMPITDSVVINPGSQIQSTGILTSTIPYPTDSEYGSVQVLLQMNGSNGSTTFIDASKNNLTSSATGVSHTTSDYRFGNACATFGNFLDTNYIELGLVEDLEPFWYFGPQSWCVEFWVKDTRSSYSGSIDFHSVFTIGIPNGLSYSGLTLGYSRSIATGIIFPEWWSDNLTRDVGIEYVTSPTYNEWTHFAFTSTYSDSLGAQYRVYINGKNPIKDGPLNYNYFGGSSAPPPKDRKVCIGRLSSGTGLTPGLIDDLRITIGNPRYTGDFAVPTFPNQLANYDYNTASVISSILVNFEGTNSSTNFVDASYNTKTLTPVNGAEISTQEYKFGVSSGYFSGSSYVSLPANQDFSFGTEDFTIEAWVYPIGSTISDPIRIFRMNSGTTNDYTFEVGSINQLVFFGASSGTSVNWTANIIMNAWNHVAWCRHNGVLYAYLNGQKLAVGSGNPANTINIANTEFNSFPAGIQGSTLYNSNECYIDNLVITKRVAKYITSFATPVLPSSFGPNDISGLFATKLNMTGIATPPNTSVSQTGWTVPSGGIVWTHTITAIFNSNADLVSFFNAGGEIYIYPSYRPVGVGIDGALYTLLDRVTRITIGGNYTKKSYSWGTLLQPNIGGANVGTSTTQLFTYSYFTDDPSFNINNTYSISLAANAAPGSSTVLTITTRLSIPRVSTFTYSNTYSSLIKYRYSSLAPQPIFAGSLSNNIAPPASVVANFTSDVTSGINPLTVNFTDTSSGSPTSWAWDFTNDGSTDSTTQNPSYTYPNAGTYSVKLTATNTVNSNTITKTNYITVNQAGIMKLTVDTSKSSLSEKKVYLPINSSVLINGTTILTPYNVTIDWGDGTISGNNDSKIHTYSQSGIYQITITGKMTAYTVESGAPQDLFDMIVSVDEWDNNLGLLYLNGAFAGAKNLISVPNTLPTTVISTSFLFSSCTSFNSSNVTQWNMSNVTDISGMFINASSFNQPIGNWNTSSVTDMGGMFGTNSNSVGPTIFNQDISLWDTSSVVNMSNMFNGNSAFNQNIGPWDVSNVTDMSAMFNSASAFNQDLTGWCVTNIPSLPFLFASGSALSSSNYPIWGTCSL